MKKNPNPKEGNFLICADIDSGAKNNGFSEQFCLKRFNSHPSIKELN